MAGVAERWAVDMRRVLSGKAVQILGPVQPVVARVKNRYREQILIKGDLASADKVALLDAFRRVAEDEPGGRFHRVEMGRRSGSVSIITIFGANLYNSLSLMAMPPFVLSRFFADGR